jgi:hypothetical protein
MSKGRVLCPILFKVYEFLNKVKPRQEEALWVGFQDGE